MRARRSSATICAERRCVWVDSSRCRRGFGAPAAHALVALMAFQAARLPARVDAGGEIVLLEEQDRTLWDRRLIALGFAHMERSAEGPRMTAYHVQAAIAAVHARSERADATCWPEILGLYDDLAHLNPSPVILLNRAVALSRVAGPDAALTIVSDLEREPALANYYLLPSVKDACSSNWATKPGRGMRIEPRWIAPAANRSGDSFRKLNELQR